MAQRAVRRTRAHHHSSPRPSARNEGAVRRRSGRALARKSSARAPVHSHAESRHARGIRRDARVAPIYKRYPDVETTILAGAGEIELHFKTRAATPDAAQAR